jgi:hypothetical protein
MLRSIFTNEVGQKCLLIFLIRHGRQVGKLVVFVTIPSARHLAMLLISSFYSWSDVRQIVSMLKWCETECLRVEMMWDRVSQCWSDVKQSVSVLKWCETECLNVEVMWNTVFRCWSAVRQWLVVEGFVRQSVSILKWCETVSRCWSNVRQSVSMLKWCETECLDVEVMWNRVSGFWRVCETECLKVEVMWDSVSMLKWCETECLDVEVLWDRVSGCWKVCETECLNVEVMWDSVSININYIILQSNTNFEM